MGAIALTVVSINNNPVAPTLYGFDIDEIAEPISNDGTYSLVTIRTYGRLNDKSSLIEARYEVQESLATIVSLSTELFLGDVIYFRGRTAQYAVSYQRVFPLEKIRTIFNPNVTSTQFNFYENENLLPIFYEVSQSIIQIINQVSPSSVFWALNGNTVGGIKTIGTKDNYDLPVITNNSEVARFTNSGNFGVGLNPSYKFDVNTSQSLLNAIARFGNIDNEFRIFTSDSSPETIISANKGDICIVDDGTNGELFIKKTGTATNTGWVNLYVNLNDLGFNKNFLLMGA